MKKKINLFSKCTIGIFCFILMSCNDVDLMNISKDIQIDESLVLPLAEGSITLEEILNQFDLKGNIGIDADTVNFVTEINKEYLFADVNLLKDAVEKIINFPLPVATVQADNDISIGTNEFQLDLGLEPNSTTTRFDSVRVSTATFGLMLSVKDIKVLSSNLGISPSDLKITIVFPKMRYFNSKAPVLKEVSINQFGQMNTFELVNCVGETAGMTGIPFQIKFKSGNRDIKVGTNGNIHIEFKINQLDYQVAYGKFELTTNTSTTLKMPLDVLSELPESLRFANPKALINLESNIGTFFRFNIESIKAFSKDASVDTVKAIFANGLESTFEIIDSKPPIPGAYISKKLKTLDRNNGSTDRLLDRTEKLDTLEFKFSVLTEEAMNITSNTPSFIIPGMKIKANIKIEVPLYFKSKSNYTLTDTIPNIDLPFEYVEKATLVLKVTNALPVKATFSLKFLDASKNVISSSLNSKTYLINSGEVYDSGIVKAETVSPINIELTKEQANEIKDAKSMIYTVKIEGQDDTKQIQFTKNNYIKVKLGAFVRVSYSTTLGTNN